MRGLSEDTTPLQFGQQVRGNDGTAGRLSDVVVDPKERSVSHIVVESEDNAARLVPAELLVAGQPPGGDVVLSCTVAEVTSLPTIRQFSYVAPEEFPQNDERSDVGVEDMQAVPGFGAVAFGDPGAELWTGYAVTYDRIPPGSAELRSVSLAVTAEGDEIGTVDGFLLVGTSLSHIVLQHTRSGAASIPIDSVSAIVTDRVTVAATDP